MYRTGQARFAPLKAVTKVVFSTMLIASLAACSWNDSRTEKLGTAVGGVLGVIVGSKVGGGTGRTIAMVVGGTLGAMWGHDVAKELSEIDQIFMERTTADTLEYGKPGESQTWSNPDSGNSGTVSANEPYTNTNGENCREFETTVNVDGESQTATATACRTKNGEWHVVDEPEAST